jgi:hypothetical protein
MQLDEFQQRWLAQDRRIEELQRATSRLQLDAELTTPRHMLRWSRIGDALEILLGVAFLFWTGSFMAMHRMELQFLIPAAALHLWGIATIGTAVARFYRSGSIDYAASVVEIQRQLESVRVFTLRSLRALFLLGVVIWGVPFAVVASRAWFGLDLYALLGPKALLGLLLANGALAFLLAIIISSLSARFDRSPRLRQLARALAGNSLTAAQDRLARIAAFAREG